jgi:hypothetical protein
MGSVSEGGFWLVTKQGAERHLMVQYNSCYILGKMAFRILNVTLRNATLCMGGDLLGTDARQGDYYKIPLFTAMSVPHPTNP